MSTRINLKELERKAWRSVFQDGLWDIYLGFLLLTMGMGPVLPSLDTSVIWTLAMLLTFSVLAWLAFWAGKKFITTPRMGLVKFGPQRKAKLKKTRAVLFLSVLLRMSGLCRPSSSSAWVPTFWMLAASTHTVCCMRYLFPLASYYYRIRAFPASCSSPLVFQGVSWCLLE
jgi:hypothetical protein